jgi:hypothetical protein
MAELKPANFSLSASFARSIVIAAAVPATSDAWLFSSFVPVISTLLTHYHFAITAILAKNDLASSTRSFGRQLKWSERAPYDLGIRTGVQCIPQFFQCLPALRIESKTADIAHTCLQDRE